MDAERPVLVIGGTSGTGLLIAQLLDRQGVRVRALARNRDRAAQRLPPQVEIIVADITRAATLSGAVQDAGHIVFTAGVRSGRPARQPLIRATEYEGVVNTLEAAKRAGFRGRFLYMTSIGVMKPSISAALLNLYKGNTLIWRRRAEDEIRDSGFDYTVIRTGLLRNAAGGTRALTVTQQALPLGPRYWMGRRDLAEAFAVALDHPCTSRTAFDVAWGSGPRQQEWTQLFERLEPDPPQKA
jgi:uncharacterized protein YbjT (DUF2867 family)